MKTLVEVQQEVLATVQIIPNELRASIEDAWGQSWEVYQRALCLYKSSAWYIHNRDLRIKYYENIKHLYIPIVKATIPNLTSHCSTEEVRREARKRLDEIETSYFQTFQNIERNVLRRQYYNLCGYTYQDEIIWDRTKPGSYRNHALVKKNEKLQKSGILDRFFIARRVKSSKKNIKKRYYMLSNLRSQNLCFR